ncbi:TPA: hypothetical protein ACH3X2_009602 [Trebouxia sp. C0005]
MLALRAAQTVTNLLLLIGTSEACLPLSTEVKAIQDKFRGKGLVNDTATGKWRTIARVICTTKAASLTRLKHELRTSFSFKNHETALKICDAALLLLSNGSCQDKSSGLSNVPTVPIAKHTKAVQRMLLEVLGYTSEHLVFLCKDDFQQRPGAQRPVTKPATATRVLPFDGQQAQAQPAAGDSGQSDGKVSIHQFVKVLESDSCNVMLNAPAWFGKTYLIIHRVWPTLKKRYRAKGVMMSSSAGTTALALGKGANTIHSAAGVGRGHGSAEKIYESMPESARKRWREVQVILIEEFSMLSAAFFELLEEVARRAKSTLPFGSVRIMLVGDVAQLPPVGDFTVELSDNGEEELHRRAPQYAFQSHLWPAC